MLQYFQSIVPLCHGFTVLWENARVRGRFCCLARNTRKSSSQRDILEGWSGLMELVFCGLRKHSQLSSMDWMVVGYYAVLLPAAEGKYVVG